MNKNFNEALRIWVVPFGICWLIIGVSLSVLLPIPPDSIREKLFVNCAGGLCLLALYISIFQYERIKGLKVRRIVKYGAVFLLFAFLANALLALLNIVNILSEKT